MKSSVPVVVVVQRNVCGEHPIPDRMGAHAERDAEHPISDQMGVSQVCDTEDRLCFPGLFHNKQYYFQSLCHSVEMNGIGMKRSWNTFKEYDDDDEEEGEEDEQEDEKEHKTKTEYLFGISDDDEKTVHDAYEHGHKLKRFRFLRQRQQKEYSSFQPIRPPSTATLSNDEMMLLISDDTLVKQEQEEQEGMANQMVIEQNKKFQNNTEQEATTTTTTEIRDMTKAFAYKVGIV
jgi:hypothetical protein